MRKKGRRMLVVVLSIALLLLWLDIRIRVEPGIITINTVTGHGLRLAWDAFGGVVAHTYVSPECQWLTITTTQSDPFISRIRRKVQEVVYGKEENSDAIYQWKTGKVPQSAYEFLFETNPFASLQTSSGFVSC